MLHTEYDYHNYLSNTVPEESFNLYRLLVKNKAVCNGYAEAMVYLLNRIGIEAIYIPSLPAMNHAWNKVKVDGTWYNMDATWDDPVPDRQGKIGYQYFLVSDSQLSKTHDWDNEGLPQATDTRYDYTGDIWASFMYQDWLYYANTGDDLKLYKIKADGTQKQKVANVRVNELVIHEGEIYFSNYSYGGYLFKMNVDGTASTQITDFHANELLKEGSILYFTDEKSGKRYKLDMNR